MNCRKNTNKGLNIKENSKKLENKWKKQFEDWPKVKLGDTKIFKIEKRAKIEQRYIFEENMVWKERDEMEEATRNCDTTKKNGEAKKVDFKLALCKLETDDKPVAKALLFSK